MKKRPTKEGKLVKIAEIFCIGTEVLIGDIANTNAMYIAKRLSEHGINVYYHTVCGDNEARMKACVNAALERADIVVTTGGLGPTYDDITKEILAGALGIPLVYHKEIEERILAYFARTGRTPTKNVGKQAYIPENAVIFENRFGTADGIAMEKDGKTVVMMPGPPREMRPMLDDQIIPYLTKDTGRVLVSVNVNIFGMGESFVEDKLSALMRNSVNPTVAPYINDGEVRLRVTASAKTEDEARAMIQPVTKQITDTLGSVVYGVDEPSIEAVVVRRLKEAGKTVSFAESCTGGLIAKRLTDVSGASDVFGYGFVTYANEAKTRLIGVNEDTLKAYGAVSEQTAREMADGARRVSGADIAVAVTGIAGPTGGTPEKPVGLVYMGIASENGVNVKKLLLGGSSGKDRAYIRTLTATNAFKAVLDVLDGTL